MTGPAVVRPATHSDGPAIARLHASEIGDGFLVLLGPDLLTRLYRRIAASDGAFAFVSTDERGLVTGFVAVAERTGRLYRDFLLRDGLPAVPRAAPALVRHLRQAVETLRHGMGTGGDRPGAEVLALAVAPGARGQGAGHSLVATALAELRRRGVTQAHVVTAGGNVAAHRTYLGCGFRRSTTIEIHRGTVQELLVWG